MAIRTSQKASLFRESVIREMTRIFLARGDKPGVNLAQGFPDFAAPEAMKQAACRAIEADINRTPVMHRLTRDALSHFRKNLAARLRYFFPALHAMGFAFARRQVRPCSKHGVHDRVVYLILHRPVACPTVYHFLPGSLV